MKVDLIAGARPNFMKISPIIDSFRMHQKLGRNIEFRLVHTGQHYDKNMSDKFFEELDIPMPDVNLGAGGGIRVAHVEAGIRSNDMRMPEEINRMVTDSITDYFFTTSENANDNLRNLGISNAKIFFVGNTMIDTLLKQRSRFIQPPVWQEAMLEKQKYFVITLHRPANVDEEFKLKKIIDAIIAESKDMPLIFPVHPRTRMIMDRLGVNDPRLFLIEPLGYLEFNYLVENCKAVITDSGGITEETTVMNVPCMTIRENTERPETVTEGTNLLLGVDPEAIKPAMQTLFEGKWKKGQIPDKWDGHAAARILDVLLEMQTTL
jgi:UDP-N-acetylglucosamine 2-epimerase (non-hydrolysing)